MEHDGRKHTSFDKIDIELFFGLLKRKLSKGLHEVVTAAMAESVRRSAVDRVLSCSNEPQSRIDELRKVLRAKERTIKG
jgi:hypothetical protein